MSEKIVYEFEGLTDDLPRPPLAALRALLQSGLLVAPKGWQALPVEARIEMARAGVRGIVDTNAVRKIAERVPPRHIKLVPRIADPNPDQLPEQISRALGPSRPLSDQDWRSIRAVDRAVLASLSANARLIALAYEELAVSMGKPQEGSAEHWFGSVARCEVKLSSAAISELMSPRFLEGRGLLLARVAGIRAARRITDTFDLHAEASTGYVELDWLVGPKRDAILWQAHVSTWEGAFFPAASMLAVMSAAAAVYDMVRETDPAAYVSKASVREEDWLVGSASSRLEETTSVYSASALMAADEQPVALAANATIRMAPEDLPRPPLADLIADALPPAPEPPRPADPPRAPATDTPRASSPSSARGAPSLDRPRASEPFAMPSPAAAAPSAVAVASPGIPRMAVFLFAGAVLIFLVSVAILAYVLVQV